MLMIDLNKIKICGRYIVKNDELFIFNGGSSLSFKVKGQSFEVMLSSCPIDSFFYVIIDRDYQNKIKAKTSSKFVYSFKDNNEHYIDIVKTNEANDCVIKLIDLSINGELLDYDHIYDKKVKVYGDSTVAGFGILDLWQRNRCNFCAIFITIGRRSSQNLKLRFSRGVGGIGGSGVQSENHFDFR